MTIVGRHPYSFLFAGGGIVLLAMLLLVRSQGTPVPANLAPVFVAGPNAPINPGISPGDQTENAPLSSSIAESSPSSPTYIPIVIGQKKQSDGSSGATEAVNPLTGPSSRQKSVSAAPSEGDQLLNYVYSLMPSGIALPKAGMARTPTQQALFDYGNEAGRIVLTFDDAHADMAQVLKEWLADRTNTAKIVSVRSIARDMQATGRSLEALSDVPSAATSANQALAKGYGDAGNKLLAVAASGGSDAALVDAMKSYDATADSFTGAYVSLADIFSLYGVTFSASDAGSAFQFSF